jgi:Uma2 family endonuclease
MTSDEFIAWAMNQPKRPRYELMAGELVTMEPERAAHARVKALIWRALDEALASAMLPCEAYPDGMAVKVDDAVTYQPDALARCGAPLPDDAVKITDPVIVVEVLSPSSRARDAGAKLEDYFRLPSVRHYLIVKTEDRTVVHHRRDADGTIQTRIVRGGPLELEPPGVTVTVELFFP